MITSRLAFEVTYSREDKDLLNAARSTVNTPEMLKDLEKALNRGANINVKDIRVESEFSSIGYYYTPLMWAAHRGHLEKVEFLIQQKDIDPMVTTGRGNTPLHIAAREGHESVVLCLAKKFPHLLSVFGEDNLTPEQIAEKYGSERKITKLFKDQYANPYFSALKSYLPFDLAMCMLGTLNDDPISLTNLSAVNKAWRKLFTEKNVNALYENSVRIYLPKNLQQLPWADIYKYYYNETAPKENAFNAFMNKLCIFYIISDAIDVLEKKSTETQVVQGLFSLVFILSHQFDPPSNMKYRLIPNDEVDTNIKAHLIINKKLTGCRNLKEAAREELSQATQPGNYCSSRVKTRKPIYEVTLKPKAAIAHMQNALTTHSLFSDDLKKVNNWRMGVKREEKADGEKMEVHSIKFK